MQAVTNYRGNIWRGQVESHIVVSILPGINLISEMTFDPAKRDEEDLEFYAEVGWPIPKPEASFYSYALFAGPNVAQGPKASWTLCPLQTVTNN